MRDEKTLQAAWENAWSAPHNKTPSGTYIGRITKDGRIYEFYEVGGGKYQYISHSEKNPNGKY
jgi:hypothetical protein